MEYRFNYIRKYALGQATDGGKFIPVQNGTKVRLCGDGFRDFKTVEIEMEIDNSFSAGQIRVEEYSHYETGETQCTERRNLDFKLPKYSPERMTPLAWLAMKDNFESEVTNYAEAFQYAEENIIDVEVTYTFKACE